MWGPVKKYRSANWPKTICKVVGFDGRLEFDTSKPDGTPRKLADVSKLKELGWAGGRCLEDGLQETYAHFLNERGAGTLAAADQ